MRHSLRTQLLQWVLLPLLCISLITAAIAYWMTFGLVRELYDDELLNSADSVITRAHWSHGAVTVNIPPDVLAVMAHDSRDRFYFQLSRFGKAIGGDSDLPVPKFATTTRYDTIRLHGEELRTLTMSVPIEAEEPDGVMLLVAETRRARSDLVSQIFGAVLVPQVLLILCGCTAVWLGVGRGLQKLENVRRAVSERSPADLHPVQADVPAEIAPLVDALNRLFAGVGEDLERQRRFVANAAHQLRTPLAGLGTYCELATRYAPAGKLKEVVSQMQTVIGRMTNLVNQLLTLAQCESANSVGKIRRSVDLNAVAAAVTAEMVPASIEKNVELELSPLEDASVIVGDAPSLHELLKNLIDNAIKYTPEHGRVIVGVLSQAPYLVLYVDDSGRGIPIDERPKIFERFYRISDVDIPGTGLGLAIVSDVARAHNAEISIETGASGIGTRVIVKFAKADDNEYTPTSAPVRSEELHQRVG